jgi:hypothetical protein
VVHGLTLLIGDDLPARVLRLAPLT